MLTTRAMRAGALLAAGAVAGVVIVVSCGGGPADSVAQASGNCTVAGPIRMVTADVDSQQLRHGLVTASQKCPDSSQVGIACAAGHAGCYYAAKLTDGPVFVTSLNYWNNTPDVFSVVGDCAQVCNPYVSTTNPTFALEHVWPILPNAVQGARGYVPGGATACVLAPAVGGGATGQSPNLSWTGFAPY